MSPFLPEWIHEALENLYNSDHKNVESIVEKYSKFCPYAKYILCE
eukprot:gene8663-610_t